LHAFFSVKSTYCTCSKNFHRTFFSNLFLGTFSQILKRHFECMIHLVFFGIVLQETVKDEFWHRLG